MGRYGEAVAHLGALRPLRQWLWRGRLCTTANATLDCPCNHLICSRLVLIRLALCALIDGTTRVACKLVRALLGAALALLLGRCQRGGEHTWQMKQADSGRACQVANGGKHTRQGNQHGR